MLDEEKVKQLRAPFPPESVHWKPQTVSKDGSKALAVAYLDARDVASRLDEVVGPMNWQVHHKEVGGEILTSLGIWDEDRQEWVWKQDVGVNESQDPGMALKGRLSDGLKRAAVLWGCGRILYDLPAQWVGYDSQRKRLTETPKLPTWWTNGNNSQNGKGDVSEDGMERESSKVEELRQKIRDNKRSEIEFLDYVNTKANKEYGELEELPNRWIDKALERFEEDPTGFTAEIMEASQ